MRSLVFALSVCLLTVSGVAGIESAPHTANVYIDSMDGFGPFLAAAIQVKAVPLVVVADRRQADFELSGAAESRDAGLGRSILNLGGSHQRASVNLINLKTGQV